MAEKSKRLLRKLLACAAVLAALYTLHIVRYLVWPPIAPLAETNPATTSFMEYRERQWQDADRKVTLRHTWRPLNRISRHLRNAVVAAEDDTFWDHDGFDWKSLREALDKNLEKGRMSVGGSTITQQLAKNLFFTPEKSLTRKAQEALVTWRLERNLDKNRILELYLNVVEWGAGVFGAEAAAQKYFGIPAARLSRQQAAVLAAMLPAPLKRTPESRHVRRVAARLLARMP